MKLNDKLLIKIETKMKNSLIDKATLITLLFLFSLSNGISQSQKEKRLINEYVAVSMDKRDNNGNGLVKWINHDTINYFIKGDLRYISKRGLRKFLLEVEQLTQINFNEVERRYDADIIIYFSKIENYLNEMNIKANSKNLHELAYWSRKLYNNDKSIKEASFCINPFYGHDMNHGIQLFERSFLNALGITGNSKDPGSLLYRGYTGQNHKFTKYDKRLLKIHYNKEISCGMYRKELEQVVFNRIDLKTLLKEKFKKRRRGSK